MSVMDLPDKFALEADQPAQADWTIADDVFIRQIVVAKRGSVIPQHAHRYDHCTFLARGGIRVWKDGLYDGAYRAPCPIVISAGVKHLFITLEDNTVILCIHNAARPDVAAVIDEHHLPFVEA